MKKLLITLLIIFLAMLLMVGCSVEKSEKETKNQVKTPPNTQAQTPPGSASPRPPEPPGPDQSSDAKVAGIFTAALRSADTKTIKQISLFPFDPATQQLLQSCGEELATLKSEEIIVTRADMGPDVTGVFLIGLKDDPGYIILAIKVEKHENKYYVTVVTDDPDYQF